MKYTAFSALAFIAFLATLTQSAIAARTELTSSITLYVASDGCDSVKVGGVCDQATQSPNDCRSSSSPCLSGQKTIEKAESDYDYRGPLHSITVQFADGAYSQSLHQTDPVHGGGTLYLRGNCTNPENVILDGVDGNPTVYASKFSDTGMCGFWVKNSHGGDLVYAAEGTVMHIDSKMKYGITTGCHLKSDYNALIFIAGDSVIEGNFGSHYCAISNGVLVDTFHTVTCNGIYAMSFFANATDGGRLTTYGNTFTGCGSMTGYRYNIWANASANLAGSTTSLPGNMNTSPGAGGVVY